MNDIKGKLTKLTKHANGKVKKVHVWVAFSETPQVLCVQISKTKELTINLKKLKRLIAEYE